LCNHPIMVRQNLSKDKKNFGLVYIRFFIYDWILTGMNLIHSYQIHNHIPIRLLFSFTTPYTLLEQEVDPNILSTIVSWGTCGSPCAYQHKYFTIKSFYRRYIVTIFRSRNFLFLHLLHEHLIPPPLIFLD